MATALAPLIGYDAAATIAHEAVVTGKSVRQLAQLKKVLSPDQLESALEPWSMTMPGLETQK
jgi:aspartate ammonia-lyase